jgi:hypothetical protein
MADDANKRVKANAHSTETNDKKEHDAKAAKMAEDITALKKKMAELVAENKEKEQTLRKVRGVATRKTHNGGILLLWTVPELLLAN